MFQAISLEFRYLIVGTFLVGILLSSSYSIIKDFNDRKEAKQIENKLDKDLNDIKSYIQKIQSTLKNILLLTCLNLHSVA